MIHSESDFLKIRLSDADMAKAQARADKLGSLRNSITQGEGNLAGMVAEDKVKDLVNGHFAYGADLYGYDIRVGKTKIEVKTKRRKVPPKLDYDVSIAKTSFHQLPDYYVFCSLNGLQLWIIGYISRLQFFEEARLIPKGTIDEQNNFICKTDMYNLSHRFLFPIREFNDVLSFESA